MILTHSRTRLRSIKSHFEGMVLNFCVGKWSKSKYEKEPAPISLSFDAEDLTNHQAMFQRSVAKITVEVWYFTRRASLTRSWWLELSDIVPLALTLCRLHGQLFGK
jgi:hypothetical protein